MINATQGALMSKAVLIQFGIQKGMSGPTIYTENEMTNGTPVLYMWNYSRSKEQNETSCFNYSLFRPILHIALVEQ